MTAVNSHPHRAAAAGRMRGLLLLVAASGLLLACSPSSSGSLGAVPTTTPGAGTPTAGAGPGGSPPATPTEPASEPGTSGGSRPGGTVTIEVWLTRDGKVFPTSRTRPATLATSRLALTELIAGPVPAEQSAGVGTGLASGTDFDVHISADVATVDLPGAFYDGGRDAARLRQAQVVFTLTQFPSVSAVGFQRDGDAAGAPVTRADYDDLLPAIVVTSLTIGQEVTSPVTIAGTANVFEATVSIRILDASGEPVATTFTTATCGTGCRGDYSTAVPYQVGSEQRGTVQVYEVSAKDGTRINVVDIPVTLTPAG